VEGAAAQIVLVLRRRPRKPFFPAFANFQKSGQHSEHQPILCAPSRGRVAQGLEGSRFPRWQLCGFAATERLRGRQAAPGNYPGCSHQAQRLARIVPIKSANISNHGGSWVAFGSRLLPSDRAAPLRSGSPPEAGHAKPRSLGERGRKRPREIPAFGRRQPDARCAARDDGDLAFK
jgi:hypothetical protein